MSDIDEMKLRRLDGGLMLVFRELLRTGRASASAERLRLSQPAISHALGRLRDLFEDDLFVRRPYGLEPTKRALELGPQIEALIELAGAALSPDRRFDPAESARRFTFSAPEFVAALIAGELIVRLGAVAPGITFAIAHLDEQEAFRGLRDGRLDFAIGRFETAKPGYVLEPLYEDRYCAVARQGHPKIRGPLSASAWRSIGHVFAWSPSETAVHEKDRGEGVRLIAAVPQWLTALMLVSGTDALATCPRRLAERHAQRLGLQVLDLPFDPDPITVSAVRRAGLKDEAADWFLGEVRRAATL